MNDKKTDILICRDSTMLQEKLSAMLAADGLKASAVRPDRLFDALEKDGGARIIAIGAHPGDCRKRLIAAVSTKTMLPIMATSLDRSPEWAAELLDAGADDVMTDACSPIEAIARIKAHMRRYEELTKKQTRLSRYGGLAIDRSNMYVTLDDRKIELTATEYRLFSLFLSRPGKVFSRDELCRAGWPEKEYPEGNTLNMHIRHMREKIEPDPARPRYIKTVCGSGYRLENGSM